MKKIFLCLFAALTFTAPAWALNVQNQRYYFHGGRGDVIVESIPKPMDTLTLGLGNTVSLNPFEFGASVGGAVQSIVDCAISFNMGASYSFSDQIALGINLPTHVTRNAQNLNTAAMETSFSLGDITLAGLYNIIDRDDTNTGIGFSLMPYINFPTGVSDNFIADANVSGGFLLVSDWEVGANYVGLNIGLRFREEENFLNLRVAQEFLYTVAYERPLLESAGLDIFAEVAGSTVLNDFFQSQNSSPIEAKLGVSKAFFQDSPVTIKLVNGLGIGNGYGNPDYRAVLSFSYDHYLPRMQVVEKTVTIERVQKAEDRLKELTIYYPTAGDQVDPFYDQKIAGIAEVMKSNPDMGPLYIVGHTDDVGDESYNQKLSERRARQAYDSILQNGLDPKDVIWFGVGEDDPVIMNSSDTNRALNRRTVFTFQKPRQIQEHAIGIPSKTETFPEKMPSSDSHTEILKVKGSQDFVDDQSSQEETAIEDVSIREETVIRTGGEAKLNLEESRKPKIKKQSHKKTFKTKSYRSKNSYDEKSLDKEDDFEESFVE